MKKDQRSMLDSDKSMLIPRKKNTKGTPTNLQVNKGNSFQRYQSTSPMKMTNKVYRNPGR